MRLFVYRYNGNERSEDIEEDTAGTIAIPSVGSLITRHGRDWRVVHIVAPAGMSGSTPLVRVFLNDGGKWRNPAPKLTQS
jgi:hypothetical protein